jgi:hypothetical protein
VRRRGRLRRLRRALSPEDMRIQTRGRDEAFRLRQAYGATSVRSRVFALPTLGIIRPSVCGTRIELATSYSGSEFSLSAIRTLPANGGVPLPIASAAVPLR